MVLLASVTSPVLEAITFRRGARRDNRRNGVLQKHENERRFPTTNIGQPESTSPWMSKCLLLRSITLRFFGVAVSNPQHEGGQLLSVFTMIVHTRISNGKQKDLLYAHAFRPAVTSSTFAGFRVRQRVVEKTQLWGPTFSLSRQFEFHDPRNRYACATIAWKIKRSITIRLHNLSPNEWNRPKEASTHR